MDVFWGCSWFWLVPVVFIALMAVGCVLMRGARGGCGCMPGGPCNGRDAPPGKVN